MNGLFNNKYYNQLFGGRQNRREGNVANAAPADESTDASETTHERLQRIFGGEPKRGRKASPEVAAKKAARAANVARRAGMSDAEYAAMKGMTLGADGLFVFANGAKARRLPSGRFQIVEGASKAKMAELRTRRGKGRAISKKSAQRAFSAYWNRKTKAAKEYNVAHPVPSRTLKNGKVVPDTRKSKLTAVKRAKSYALSHYRTKVLDESSPKGYLYLRKEKMTKRRNSRGATVMRRAGPAIYSFEGVAPVTRTTKSGKVIAPARRQASKTGPSAKQQAARRDFAERMAAYRRSQGYASTKKSSSRSASRAYGDDE